MYNLSFNSVEEMEEAIKILKEKNIEPEYQGNTYFLVACEEIESTLSCNDIEITKEKVISLANKLNDSRGFSNAFNDIAEIAQNIVCEND